MAKFNDVANAVKVVLDTITGAPTTIVRKNDATHPRDSSSFPLCVISLGADEHEQWATTGNGTTDQGTIGIGLTIVISVYQKCLGDIQSNMTVNPTFFEDAKQALNKRTLSGVASIWNTTVQTNQAWEQQDFSEGYEVSQFTMTFMSGELRNG